jgi:hypothetical protein
MSNSTPIPIRIYQEFTKRDWPKLPGSAQDALASFLVRLQTNPDSPEIVGNIQQDSLGRLGLEFSPGYVVYWQIVRNVADYSGQPERIEVLALVKTQIEFSKTRKEAPVSGLLPTQDTPDQLERVYSRNATLGALSMWGSLHVSRLTGKVKGWIANSWSQGGPPFLRPRIHWASLPDYKLYQMMLNIDFNSRIEVGPEDTEVEPERLVFVRATLRQWEKDWLEEESKKIS